MPALRSKALYMKRTGDQSDEQQIRAASSPNCIICGRAGMPIYPDQQDRLFNAPGSWNYIKCSDPACALVWLDPKPLQEDIWKAYISYYTHTKRSEECRDTLPRRTLQRMKRGYLAKNYGYGIDQDSPFSAVLGKLLYLLPILRRETEADVRFLQAVPNGRLLDVGCGAGEWLVSMHELGWQVEGVDFDCQAVEAARQSGVPAKCGSLQHQAFLDNSFDAITLNHVIEHVPDPAETVAECARILKPGGKLVLLTPNSTSLSHRIFKENWRGLEPPRHLHLFSMRSMQQLLYMAGFRNILIKPFIVTSVIYESLLLRWNHLDPARLSRRKRPAWLLTQLLKLMELFLLKFDPSVGDCVTAVAVKK